METYKRRVRNNDSMIKRFLEYEHAKERGNENDEEITFSHLIMYMPSKQIGDKNEVQNKNVPQPACNGILLVIYYDEDSQMFISSGLCCLIFFFETKLVHKAAIKELSDNKEVH